MAIQDIVTSNFAKDPVPLRPTNLPNICEPLDAETQPPPRFLQASPYPEAAHLLDLETLGRPQQLLARALTAMAALTPAYATAPYAAGFNWAAVAERLAALVHADGGAFPRTAFYVIVFRSQVPPDSRSAHLGALDRAAHAEAVASGGLLKYWFGAPDAAGRNLATCVWRGREDARRGGAGKVGVFVAACGSVR